MTVDKERLPRELIAMRVAAELHPGEFVNLGIGIPNLVADFTPDEKGIIYHAENGILGLSKAQMVGAADVPDMRNAGGQPVTMIKGGWLMDSADSFAIVRGGHLDVAVLGGLQVSETGDLANWMRPGRAVGAVGGAADIATGARKLYIAMEHTTKDGEVKIVRECSYPLTARRCVSTSSWLGIVSSDSDAVARSGSPRRLLSLIASRSSLAESALRTASS